MELGYLYGTGAQWRSPKLSHTPSSLASSSLQLAKQAKNAGLRILGMLSACEHPRLSSATIQRQPDLSSPQPKSQSRGPSGVQLMSTDVSGSGGRLAAAQPRCRLHLLWDISLSDFIPAAPPGSPHSLGTLCAPINMDVCTEICTERTHEGFVGDQMGHLSEYPQILMPCTQKLGFPPSPSPPPPN